MAVVSRNVALGMSLLGLVGCAAVVGLDKKYEFTDDGGVTPPDVDAAADAASDSPTVEAGPSDAGADRRPPTCTLATTTVVNQPCKNCLVTKCEESLCLCQAQGNNCKLGDLGACVDECRRNTPDASLVQCLTVSCQRNSATNLAGACVANAGCFDRCF